MAQPLFEVLKPDATFFVARRSEPVDIIVLAVAVVLLVPLALAVLEGAVGLFSRRLRRAVHAGSVSLLLALTASSLVKRSDLVPPALLVPLTVACGVAGTIVYLRWGPARTFVAVLAPVPIIFAALFLLHPTIAKLAFPESLTSASHSELAIDAKHKVVFIILDELPTASLLDANRVIDPILFPNFARLAQASTWFRNASTSHEGTSHAIPCIMTGKTPTQDALPIAADHAESVFTLLGGQYRLSVVETLTAICPPELNELARAKQPFADRMRSLGLDSSLVYAHIVLPESMAANLPAVTDNWAGFWKQSAVSTTSADEHLGGPELYVDRSQVWRDFIASIDAADPATLYLHHSLMPHVPWTYLHTGHRYAHSQISPGLTVDGWLADSTPRMLGLQRHLLQTGHVDRLLGELLDHLEAEGLWDDCLFVLVADHGAAFQARQPRRAAKEPTLSEILYVPLFVKLPGQPEGRISDRNVESIDVLPTVADALGIEIPWHVDGESALDESHPERPTKTLWGYARLATKPLVTGGGFSDSWPGLERRIAAFGESPSWEDIYALGPHPELLGRSVGELGAIGNAEVTLEIAGGTQLLTVDTESERRPSFVTGLINTDEFALLDLAIAVNGTIRGTATTFRELNDERPHFGVILPEESFQHGRNVLELYIVDDQGGLALLTALSYGLATAEGGERVECSDGRSFDVVPGDMRGSISWDVIEGDVLRVMGWAYDVADEVPAELVVLVTADGQPIRCGSTGVRRPEIAKRLGASDAIETSGFILRLPLLELGGSDPAKMRAFAVGARTATELIGKTGKTGGRRARRNAHAAAVAPPSCKLVDTAGAERIECPNGRSFDVVPGDVRGSIRWDVLQGDVLRVVGWAYDVADEVPAELIVLVTADGQPIRCGSTGVRRPKIAERLGASEAIEASGFILRLPLSELGGSDPTRMRAFAVGTGTATELTRKAGGERARRDAHATATAPPSCKLVDTAGAERVECTNGRSFDVVPGDVRGSIRWDVLQGDVLRIVGWAYDVANEVPAEMIVLVTADGRPIRCGSTGVRRPKIAEHLGASEEFETLGFVLRLPLSELGGSDPAGMRAFAVGTGTATELEWRNDQPSKR